MQYMWEMRDGGCDETIKLLIHVEFRGLWVAILKKDQMTGPTTNFERDISP